MLGINITLSGIRKNVSELYKNGHFGAKLKLSQ